MVCGVGPARTVLHVSAVEEEAPPSAISHSVEVAPDHARPRPLPPSARLRAFTSRWKRSKTWGKSAAEVPGPLRAPSRTLPAPARVVQCCSAGGAHLHALTSRLRTAVVRAPRSQLTSAGGVEA